jgi:hypothetical protein
MTRKITFLIACAFLLAGLSVSAQETTKVSKKIEVFDWLNAAVADGNQIEGGMHTYADFADLTAKMKLKRIKVGMLVNLTTGTDKGTYRLKAWATTTALPLKNEWEKVAESIVVDNTAARDLLVAEKAKTTLAQGTVVLVKTSTSNNNGMEAFVYVSGYADETANLPVWFSLGNSSNSNGFIYAGQGGFGKTNGFQATDATGKIVSAYGTTFTNKLISFPNAGLTFDLTAGSGAAFVAFPKSWNKPTFYLDIDGTEYPLNDCWKVEYSEVDGIDFQKWSADFDFTAGSTNTLKLVIK